MVSARTLVVGANREFKLPSAAASVAGDGDTIAIDAGEYFDCAVWQANGLTIEGSAENVVITDKTCEGKALFVTRGNDITMRNLTFARARVADGNGAGIRAEGINLRVEHSRFVNNESGILVNSSPTATVTVVDSEFIDDGRCAGSRCSHALSVDEIALLHVESCVFKGTRGGHHIASRAARNELIGNEIADGADGTSSYLVDIPNGGSLVMMKNILEKGPKSSNPATAIMLGEDTRTRPIGELSFSGNRFSNDTGTATIFIRNWTSGEIKLDGNVLGGRTTAVSSDGHVLHQLRVWSAQFVAQCKILVKAVLRRMTAAPDHPSTELAQGPSVAHRRRHTLTSWRFEPGSVAPGRFPATAGSLAWSAATNSSQSPRDPSP
jgi:hypothetical protein